MKFSSEDEAYKDKNTNNSKNINYKIISIYKEYYFLVLLNDKEIIAFNNLKLGLKPFILEGTSFLG